MYKLLLRKNLTYNLKRNLFSNILKGFSTENEEPKNINNDDKISDSSNKEHSPKQQNSNYINFNNILSEIDNSIIDGVFQIKNLPDPNFFNEALLYFCPYDLLYRTGVYNEYAGALFSTMLTYLSYHKIILTSNYLFPYFSFITVAAYFRSYLRFKSKNPIIYQITLINEHQIKIVFVGGRASIVEIKNIGITRVHSSESKGVGITLNLKYNNFERGVLILKNSYPYDKVTSFADLNLLMGILNKKTKKINIV
jgi:hypothetical protein